MRRVQSRCIHAANRSCGTVCANRALEERTRRSYCWWTWLDLHSTVAEALSTCYASSVSLCVATPCDYPVFPWPDTIALCPVYLAVRVSLSKDCGCASRRHDYACSRKWNPRQQVTAGSK